MASLIASVAALVLAVSFAFAAYAADDDPPLTAAEVSSMVPPASGAPAESPPRPTFTTPSVPPIENPGYDDPQVSAPQMQEIPQASPEMPRLAAVPSNPALTSPNVSNYMNEDPNLTGSVGSVRDFVEEGQMVSPGTSAIGFQLRESTCRLKTGERIDGLLILQVAKGSPAAEAGLQSYKTGKEHALQAVAIGAGIAFPPAMLLTMVALPMIEYSGVGKSYDMIIGVDGARVNNFYDFQERMRNVQPGEVVYLNLVRNGKRIQVAVPVPALATAASN